MSYPPPLPPAQQPPYTSGVIDYARQGVGRACPGCGGGPLAEPSFTWWGGLVGHKILGVERCESCRKWWVKKTGAPGGTRVLIYSVGGIVLGIVVVGAIMLA